MIHTSGLTKVFKGQRVLDALDLEIAPGERVALVGANGAGKTTLIRCLLGEYAHQGAVAIGSLSPRLHRRDVLRRVGFVPQLPPPLRMPVGGLLDFASEVCGSDPERMEAISARLGLDARSVWRRPFAKLSGGQKQKLLIAVALGRSCDLLILDEPAANLDPQARSNFFALLAERQGEATMLISSHRIDEVASLVTRVVELDQGRVVVDDRIDGGSGLGVVLRCRIELVSSAHAAAKALGEWGFDGSAGGTVFQGSVAGPDRLRFLGAMARYSGAIRALELAEPGAARAEQ